MLGQFSKKFLIVIFLVFCALFSSLFFLFNSSSSIELKTLSPSVVASIKDEKSLKEYMEKLGYFDKSGVLLWGRGDKVKVKKIVIEIVDSEQPFDKFIGAKNELLHSYGYTYDNQILSIKLFASSDAKKNDELNRLYNFRLSRGLFLTVKPNYFTSKEIQNEFESYLKNYNTREDYFLTVQEKKEVSLLDYLFLPLNLLSKPAYAQGSCSGYYECCTTEVRCTCSVRRSDGSSISCSVAGNACGQGGTCNCTTNYGRCYDRNCSSKGTRDQCNNSSRGQCSAGDVVMGYGCSWYVPPSPRPTATRTPTRRPAPTATTRPAYPTPFPTGRRATATPYVQPPPAVTATTAPGQPSPTPIPPACLRNHLEYYTECGGCGRGSNYAVEVEKWNTTCDPREQFTCGDMTRCDFGCSDGRCNPPPPPSAVPPRTTCGGPDGDCGFCEAGDGNSCWQDFGCCHRECLGNTCGTVDGSGTNQCSPNGASCMAGPPEPPDPSCNCNCDGQDGRDPPGSCGQCGGGWCNGGRCNSCNGPPPPPPPPPPTDTPWEKGKNLSFHKYAPPWMNEIPGSPQVFNDTDPDDEPNRSFVNGEAGVISTEADAGSINLGGGSDQYSTHGWHINQYDKAAGVSVPDFITYVRARKTFAETSVNNLQTGKINIINGNVIISDAATNQSTGTLNETDLLNKAPILLISEQSIRVEGISDGSFNQGRASIALMSPREINIDGTINEANGIFIAPFMSTGPNTQVGLKIAGNVIAETLSNERSRNSTKNRRPGFFVVFDPTMYIPLIPYLSTISFDWAQIQ